MEYSKIRASLSSSSPRKLVFYVLLIGSVAAAGQNMTLNTKFYGPEEGLSHRDVQSIFQDRRGFMWFGTNYGLNRFDGYQFRLFTKEKNGLQSNMINHIVGDGEGLMWLFNTAHHFFQTPIEIDIFNPVTEEVVSFEKKFDRSAPLKVADIYSFTASTDGQLFFSTTKNQLIIYTSGKGFEVNDLEIKNFVVHDVSMHRTIWGYCYNPLTKIREEIVEVDFKGHVLHRYKPAHSIRNLFIAGIDKSDHLWYVVKWDESKLSDVSRGELFRINARFESEPLNLRKKNQPIDSLNLDRQGFAGRYLPYWNTLRGSFYLFGGKSFQICHPEEDWYFDLGPSQKYLATTNVVYFDRQGQAWVGTDFGVYHIEINHNPFSQILKTGQEANFLAFRGITQDGAGNYWAANDRGKGWLWRFNKRKDGYILSDFQATCLYAAQKPGYKYALLTDSKGALWFGSGEAKFLLKYQPQTDECLALPLAIPPKNAFEQVNIWSFYEDEQGNVWFGTDAGQIGYVDDKQKITLLPELEGVNQAGGCIYQFLKDKTGTLWVVTDNGLYLLNRDAQTVQPYHPKTGILPWKSVLFMFQDEDGSFWLGTRELGLFHWNPEKDAIEQFTKADGLSSNTIYAIYEDEFRHLWMSSDYGIIRFDRSTRQFKAYLQQDGITHNEFNRISHYKAPDGTLLFGSLNGITIFHPKDFQADSLALNVPLVITGFHQFVGGENKLLDMKKELLRTHRITINPDDRFFQLEFALLTFSQTENVRYAYRIEGVDADWNYQTENSIRFSHLPYGKHLLRIKGQLANGNWSEQELAISLVVLKPFYLQTWFLVCLVLALFSGIYGYAQWRLKSLKERQVQLERVVAERTHQIEEDKKIIQIQNDALSRQAEFLKSVEEHKSRFFANVSHELRTPLTLILGPVSTLYDSGELSKKNLKLLKLVQSNAQGLLKLVSSILDLSKMEAAKLEIRETSQALFPLTRRLASSFESHAQRLELDFLFEYKADKNLQLKLDAQRVETIVNNLLSNAMKFTLKGGTVTFRVFDEGNIIGIEIIDTGRGIHPSDLPHVFERFYQSQVPGAATEGGTGIGLTLSMELARLMGGNIAVSSEWQRGSRFCLEIPRKEVLGAASEVWTDLPPAVQPVETEQEPQETVDGDGGFLLIVEDNYSLREYLETILSGRYTIRSASNGKEALQILPECMDTPIWKEKGGLILSDIMMPVMDGFQLLDFLKSDPILLHIPLIILTARADIKDKLHALRTGVDDYLLKPFIEAELLARTANLLSNYRRRGIFAGELPALATSEKEQEQPGLSPDNLLWLAELEAKVRPLITSDTLNVEWIAGQVFMSERQLYRRLKTLTGLTVNEYIREMRLQEARYLLENRVVDSVKKAARTVGFYDLKYFTQIFRARFGKNPSGILDAHAHLSPGSVRQ